jgi:hypothetical protein
MQLVLMISHGSFPLPGSPGSKALTEAERQAIYAEYAELNKDPGITLRLPPIAPGKATTVGRRQHLEHDQERRAHRLASASDPEPIIR